jgi:CDP-diglyceride synthetase
MVCSACLLSHLAAFTSRGIPFAPSHSQHIGLALGVVGIIGDLFESFIKRAFKRKDTADWLPGWGGVLDRIDGLLLNFPLAYYWIEFFY